MTTTREPGWLERHTARCAAEQQQLLAALREPGESQRRVLAELLAANADTAFGREHGLAAVRDLAGYRAAVPIRDYDGMSGWIERAAAGEPGVLTADDPVVFFRSSGTTGDSKKIPVTAAFMRRVYLPFFYAAWATALEHHPGLLARDDATLNFKYDPGGPQSATPSGRPHLGASQVDIGRTFAEDLAVEPGMRAPWGRLPVPVTAEDHLERLYLRLRLAVGHDVRGVVGINPAIVAAVPHLLDRWWPRIVKDLHDGTLAGRPYGDRDRARAAELERTAERYGTVRPLHVWPGMEVLLCWVGGAASLYLPRLREEFGTGVAVLPAPLAASESPLTVPVDRHPSGAPLMVSAVLFEFVDAAEDVAPDSPTLGPAELADGGEYHVVVSHVGGLYRYALGDVVRVLDRRLGVPRVTYAGRRTRSDAAGERLREADLVVALQEATAATGVEVRNASCRVASDGGTPGYEVAVAPLPTAPPPLPAELSAYAARVDEALSRRSPAYAAARAAGRLGPVTAGTVDPAAFARDWERRVGAGVRPAQAKDRLFRPDPATWDALTAG